MTTLENRPNTALLVVDAQNGVLEGAHERDAVVANVGQPSREGAAGTGSRCLGPALRRAIGEGKRRLADRPRVDSGRHRAARSEELRRLIRRQHPRDRVVGPRCWRLVVVGAETDACIRSTLHGAIVRGTTPPGQRRPHDRGPHGMGSAAAGPGHRAHEPLLDVPEGAGTNGRDGRNQRHRLRRHVLTATSSLEWCRANQRLSCRRSTSTQRPCL